MKRIAFSFVALTLLTSCSTVIKLTPQMQESLAEQMNKDLYIVEEFPQDPYIGAVFVYIDGVPIAVATCAGQNYFAYKQSGWDVYRFKNGKWQKVEGFIVAQFGDFYVLVEEGQKPKLVVISMEWERVWDKEEGYTGEAIVSRVAYQITIDKNGELKTISMPEFEFKNYSSYADLPAIKLKSPKDKLNPIKVETFYPKGFVPKE